MIPAAVIFDPLAIKAVGADLRAARFDPDPSVARRGVCVVLNGQTEFIEKYFEVIDELRGRGFAVATMDWRGQGGSSRLLTDDHRKSFITDFAEYDQDLDTLLNWIVTPMLKPGEKPVALAHSMGLDFPGLAIHDAKLIAEPVWVTETGLQEADITVRMARSA